MIKFLLTYTYTWWSSCRLEPVKEILVAFLCRLKVDFSVLYFHLFAKFEKLSEFVLHFVARTVVRWKHLKFLLVYIFQCHNKSVVFLFYFFQILKTLELSLMKKSTASPLLSQNSQPPPLSPSRGYPHFSKLPEFQQDQFVILQMANYECNFKYGFDWYKCLADWHGRNFRFVSEGMAGGKWMGIFNHKALKH